MQSAPADHAGPVRMGLREPVGTSPLCRVASHALFGPWLRGGSPPVPDRRKLPESADLASGNFRNAGRCRPAAGTDNDASQIGELNHGLHGIHGLCSALLYSPSVSIRVICEI
jgi:hypothetical protein